MKNEIFYKRLKKIKKYYINILVLATLTIVSLLAWSIDNEVKHYKNLALEYAKISFDKDLIFRKWAASHGGVYVPPTKRTPSNQYLINVEDKDVVTTTGKKLTLMNPAYMIRQLMEENEGLYGAKGHITSLILLNPKNKPSDWETKALKLFDKGEKEEVYEFLNKDGKEYIYYMKALVTEESCLKCHAHQGYKIGDTRGGVSVVIPMEKYDNEMYGEIIRIISVFFIFYMIAIVGMIYTYGRLKASLLEQEKLFDENRKKDEIMLAQSRNAAMGEMISMIAHQWRQPIAIISMWANNIIADIDMDEVHNDDFKKYAKNINEQTQYLSQTIDDFRNFFKPDKAKEKVLIQDVMDECLGVVGKSLQNSNVHVEKNYTCNTPISIHARELMQVYINILKNAKEALVEQEIKDAKVIINIYEDENSVVCEIKDNANGIKEEIMQKIFDPYFTTKGVHSGTGIGLYMSKIIVEQHLHGTISAVNIKKGVCFSIVIPKK
ncbi:DUF3365 domain-containing protein [Candidatus Sulfurimonas marisnigri]|uniref:histidine kinase n=1 Tax=Candidatus Sulfurimonas marisnigri TaxID=2740405 RepID=A0A7S7M0G0_9BACT|nr:DUF3365 domain-containing protein [Candidatus Sulfurimonas marisnigri]QOY54827.1 DUF3365 domain-containing protein [Candidatus Sulfurimonas marisnigri]